MFILTKISDLVQISAEDLKKPSREAIEDNINGKYANKVIQKIGLCICLYDLLSSSQGLIGHGTGTVNVNVVFRLIVFRPFKHEVILGNISSSHLDGIRLRTSFFDDIFVPSGLLPEGSTFDHNEQLWVWYNDGHPYYYDHHETVRFRVDSETWFDTSPTGPGSPGVERDLLQLKAENGEQESEKPSPYQIQASMAEEGMGPVLWWDVDDDEGEETIS